VSTQTANPWRLWPKDVLEDRTCPGWINASKPCGVKFATERGLRRHMRVANHEWPFFRFARHVTKESCTCTLCGYVPAFNVDNPVKCYRDHMRRRHRLEYVRERKPYTIAEEP
jgi:hypothetical protein